MRTPNIWAEKSEKNIVSYTQMITVIFFFFFFIIIIIIIIINL